MFLSQENVYRDTYQNERDINSDCFIKNILLIIIKLVKRDISRDIYPKQAGVVGRSVASVEWLEARTIKSMEIAKFLSGKHQIYLIAINSKTAT